MQFAHLRPCVSFVMMTLMKTLLGVFFILLAGTAQAYSPEVVEPEKPFDSIIITDNFNHEFLGTLDGFPDMFEFVIQEETELTLQLLQKPTDEPVSLGLILIEVDPLRGGVTEIIRLKESVEEWSEVRYSSIGVTLLETSMQQVTLEPGIYRAEVSTPVNEGVYMLKFQSELSDSGYFSSIKGVWVTQRHFDFSWLQIFLSTYVYYTLGILLILAGLIYTWKRRKAISHVA